MTDSTFSTRNFVLNSVLALFAIPAALSVLAFGARWHWLLDLCTHFRAHYLTALAVATLICLLSRRFKLAAAFGVIVGLNLYFVAPLYFSVPTNAIHGTSIRLMTVNAYCANQNRNHLSEYIAETSPDVVLVMEIDGGWAARLEALSDDYTHRIIETRTEDCFGIALLSKLPAKQLEVRMIGPAGVPSIFAQLETADGRSFFLIGTHPVPPVSRLATKLRNQQLEEIGQLVATLQGPVVVLGDFNTTSWSPAFRDLLAATKLRDSRKGFGNQPSWRSDIVLCGIAIDHVLVSADMDVHNRFVGADVGSDHRPVTVDVTLRK